MQESSHQRLHLTNFLAARTNYLNKKNGSVKVGEKKLNQLNKATRAATERKICSHALQLACGS